jgi:hypothetical protein
MTTGTRVNLVYRCPVPTQSALYEVLQGIITIQLFQFQDCNSSLDISEVWAIGTGGEDQDCIKVAQRWQNTR